MTTKADLAASVAARLLNRAKQAGDDYQALLTSYCLERFLYRLAVSSLRDRFVLKGAMLLRLWSDRPYRATLDLDLLRRGDGTFEAVRDDLRAIVATPVPGDAVDFDGDRIRIEAIRPEDEYSGARATLPARCGKARLMLQIDMGLADVRRTFARRNTPIPSDQPIALTREYWDNPSRPMQVRAFARRARISVTDDFAGACVLTLDAFLTPVWEDLRAGRGLARAWRPGGPWQ